MLLFTSPFYQTACCVPPAGRVAAFIHETIQGVGGAVPLADGYLPAAYKARAALASHTPLLRCPNPPSMHPHSYASPCALGILTHGGTCVMYVCAGGA
jgi:hypothetical protein